MLSLKSLFLRIYSLKTWLGAVWYWAELDSAQYHTVPSPKIQNCLTLRGVGLSAVLYCAKSDYSTHSVSLRRVKQFFLRFSKTYISMTFRIYVMIFREKNRKYFENPRLANTAPSPTRRSVILCRVQLRPVWYCAKSDSAQYNIEQSQKLKFIAQGFARNNLVFAGLSLHSMRILNFLTNICVLLQHSPTFFIYIL